MRKQKALQATVNKIDSGRLRMGSAKAHSDPMGACGWPLFRASGYPSQCNRGLGRCCHSVDRSAEPVSLKVKCRASQGLMPQEFSKRAEVAGSGVPRTRPQIYRKLVQNMVSVEAAWLSSVVQLVHCWHKYSGCTLKVCQVAQALQSSHVCP